MKKCAKNSLKVCVKDTLCLSKILYNYYNDEVKNNSDKESIMLFINRIIKYQEDILGIINI